MQTFRHGCLAQSRQLLTHVRIWSKQLAMPSNLRIMFSAVRICVSHMFWQNPIIIDAIRNHCYKWVYHWVYYMISAPNFAEPPKCWNSLANDHANSKGSIPLHESTRAKKRKLPSSKQTMEHRKIFHMVVSWNYRGTHKSSMFIGLSTINQPFWDTSIYGNLHIIMNHYESLLTSIKPRYWQPWTDQKTSSSTGFYRPQGLERPNWHVLQAPIYHPKAPNGLNALNQNILCIKENWLVVWTPLKNMKVNWDD